MMKFSFKELISLIGSHRGSSPLHRGKGFYSHYFLIPKAKEGLRATLDLQQLNKHLKKIKFCMIMPASIIPSLDPGDWYATLDLKDACFHVAIHQSYRKFLRLFIIHSHYQFTVLSLACPQYHVFSQSTWQWWRHS